jgi:hypothetical protein
MLPLQLRLKPSRYLTYFVILTWLALLGLLISAAVNLGLVAVFAFCSVILYWRWLRTYAWQSAPHSLLSIKVNTLGWHLGLRDGTKFSAVPTAGCRFWPGLIVLRLRKLEGGVFWWVLLADCSETESLRRLRMVGLWGPKYFNSTSN